MWFAILICVILNSFIGSFLFSEVSLIKFSSKEVIKVIEIYFKGVEKRLEEQNILQRQKTGYCFAFDFLIKYTFVLKILFTWDLFYLER